MCISYFSEKIGFISCDNCKNVFVVKTLDLSQEEEKEEIEEEPKEKPIPFPKTVSLAWLSSNQELSQTYLTLANDKAKVSGTTILLRE